MHKYEIAVLRALKKGGGLGLRGVMDAAGLGKDETLWAIQNLAAAGLVTVKKELREEAALSPEGNECADRGLPERILAERLASAGPVAIAGLKGKEEQIGFMWAKKKGLVTIDKGMLRLTARGREAAGRGMDEEKILKDIQSDRESYSNYKNTEAVSEFRKRGLLEARSREEASEIRMTEKGARAAGAGTREEELMDGVDRGVIKGRLWAGKKFREYNVGAPVEPASVAMRHPLRKVIDDLKASYRAWASGRSPAPSSSPPSGSSTTSSCRRTIPPGTCRTRSSWRTPGAWR